ncbi:MAG: hypothetical protein F8N36_14245 [Desulfovibrio sp.]|nr:hypothetical protein [Desulfovibrio sp.]
MSTQRNKIHSVTPIARVAIDLGVDEDWLWDNPANQSGIALRRSTPDGYLYPLDELDRWAANILTPLRHSTSDGTDH